MLGGCCEFGACRPPGSVVAWDSLGTPPIEATPSSGEVKQSSGEVTHKQSLAEVKRKPRTVAATTRAEPKASPFYGPERRYAFNSADLTSPEPWVREEAMWKKDSARMAKIIEICRGCLSPVPSYLTNLKPTPPSSAVASVR